MERNKIRVLDQLIEIDSIIYPRCVQRVCVCPYGDTLSRDLFDAIGATNFFRFFHNINFSFHVFFTDNM